MWDMDVSIQTSGLTDDDNLDALVETKKKSDKSVVFH